MLSLPSLGFQIVDVHMIARARIGDHFTDVLAVFDNRVAGFEVGERHLVPDRNIGFGLEVQGGVVFGDDAEHVGAGFQPFDDNDTDIVLGAVNEKMWGRHVFPLLPVTLLEKRFSCVLNSVGSLISYIRLDASSNLRL